MKIATVCSGIGSPEQALKDLNINHEIVFACEIDKYARKSYLANFNPKYMFEDMTKESWEGNHLYSDLFIGGIPCQSFSLAGKRLGEQDPRGLLFYDFYRYVKIQSPKYFIIENVKGLLSDKKGTTFNNWCSLLGQSINGVYNDVNHEDSLKYNLHYKVLNTKDYGLPQNRERVFLVGIRNDLPNYFKFPEKESLLLCIKDILENEVDEKYFMSEDIVRNFIPYNNPKSKDNSTLKLMGHLDMPGHESMNRVYDQYGICPTINTMSGGNRQPKIMISNESNLKSDKSIILGKINNSQDGIVFDVNGISQCLSAGHGNSPKILDKFRIRKLTPKECMRLQGFPDDFKQPVSDTQIYKQSGNTISVNVLKSIIKNISI